MTVRGARAPAAGDWNAVAPRAEPSAVLIVNGLIVTAAAASLRIIGSLAVNIDPAAGAVPPPSPAQSWALWWRLSLSTITPAKTTIVLICRDRPGRLSQAILPILAGG